MNGAITPFPSAHSWQNRINLAHTQNDFRARPIRSSKNTMSSSTVHVEFHTMIYILGNKQKNVFENLFLAGATQHLRKATQRRNISSDAEISI